MTRIAFYGQADGQVRVTVDGQPDILLGPRDTLKVTMPPSGAVWWLCGFDPYGVDARRPVAPVEMIPLRFSRRISVEVD